MKIILKLVGGLVGLVILVFALQMVASESGEVVVVQTKTVDGQVAETRVWVVEHQGSTWLRSGSPESGWYQRMIQNPEVQVRRGEQVFTATVVPQVGLRDAINTKMNAKYGWADDFVALMFGRDDAIPLQLQRQP